MSIIEVWTIFPSSLWFIKMQGTNHSLLKCFKDCDLAHLSGQIGKVGWRRFPLSASCILKALQIRNCKILRTAKVKVFPLLISRLKSREPWHFSIPCYHSPRWKAALQTNSNCGRQNTLLCLRGSCMGDVLWFTALEKEGDELLAAVWESTVSHKQTRWWRLLLRVWTHDDRSLLLVHKSMEAMMNTKYSWPGPQSPVPDKTFGDLTKVE